MTVQLIVLVLLLQLQEITKATDPVFVEKPQTVHTILNKTAYFQCICRGCVGQFWELNEGSPSNSQNKAKGVDADGPYFLSNGDKLYNLSMPALNELNNSNITCYIYKGATTLPSGLVHLHIQGFLSQVSNTTIVQFNITTLKLSFSAPFTLANVSILYYIIEIRDEDTSDVMIINTTSLTSLINIKDYCNKHMIYITPWNGLGGGETSIISDVIFYKNPQTVVNLELITDYNETKLLNNIQFQVNTTCIGTIPQIVNITANCSSECETVHLGPCVLHLLDHNITSSGNCSITTSNTQVIIDLSEHLLSGHYYELDVIVMTLEIQGISPLVKSFYISTFHTVKAEITSATLTSVCIKCTLKTGSTSQGCVVIFQDTSGKNGNISRQIDRTPDEVIAYKCIEDLPDGIYKVLITDSEIYQEKGVSNIAFELTANFVIMRPTELLTDVEEMTSHIQKELASSTKTTVTSSQASSLSSTQDLMTSYFVVVSTNTVLTITPELTNIPKREQDTPLDDTVLLAAVCATGVVFGLLILVIIVLLIRLIKTRKKAKRYKIGEEDALRRQRNTELMIQCSSLPISIQTLEPVYENMQEIPDKSTVLMTQSPAYETVPVCLTLPTSPN